MAKKRRSKRKNKKLKIRFGRVVIALIILFLILYFLSQIFKFPIKNIFVYNNTMFSDQEIIDMAGISNYPSIIATKNSTIEKRLEKNNYIKKAVVSKKKLKEVHIKIEENYPLFYSMSNKKTTLKDGQEIKEKINSAVLINYVPDTIYKDFILKMQSIDSYVLKRISEIKYDPNDVDSERFLLTMNDGNYVYLTLIHFDKINNYVEILKNFENKKGILYLDSGEYFKVFE